MGPEKETNPGWSWDGEEGENAVLTETSGGRELLAQKDWTDGLWNRNGSVS